jgi:ABC-type transport system involved in cytochrome bd biosynthesis fused ATPase/permease subunit
MISPITLFAVFSFLSGKTGFVLFCCVPLIPILIGIITTCARRLFSKYWGIYLGLGDTFLENLHGLTTLKIYQADEYRHKLMNRDSEQFRQITMKVLVMQLSSIIIMDLVACGGAGVGIVMALLDFKSSLIEPALICKERNLSGFWSREGQVIVYE